ncbi:uncharacterized protein LOC144211949 [Stigmatopora nigra]
MRRACQEAVYPSVFQGSWNGYLPPPHRSFATLANKVNRGLPVFNKVFTGRAEVLWQHVVKLHALAGHLATFHQKAKVAGVTAIAGLALAPFTFGASRIATAGGVRSASASISDNVNNIQERKKTLNATFGHQRKSSQDVVSCKFLLID